MSDKAYLAALHRVDELKRERDQLREALDGLLSYTRACESLLNASESGQCKHARAALKAAEDGGHE